MINSAVSGVDRMQKVCLAVINKSQMFVPDLFAGGLASKPGDERIFRKSVGSVLELCCV
jgi:hypothetical protein